MVHDLSKDHPPRALKKEGWGNVKGSLFLAENEKMRFLDFENQKN